MLRQLSVFVENKPGSFRRAVGALRTQGICIQAFCSVDSPEFGILRLIVDQTEAAQKILAREGFLVKSYDVLGVRLEKPETLDDLLFSCLESNININYTYSSCGGSDGAMTAILHCEYLDETESLLRSRGFACLDAM